MGEFMEQNLKEEKRLLKKIMIKNLEKAQKEMTINYAEFLILQDRKTFDKYLKSFEWVQSLTKTLNSMIKGD
jgi:hypothetical protein